MIRLSPQLPLAAALFLALAAGRADAQAWTTYAYPNDLRDITRVGSTLWMASTGGALRYDLGTGEFQQYPRRASGGPLSQSLTSVAFDAASDLVFFGSADQGLSQYSPTNDRWERFEFLPSNEIQNVSPLDDDVYIGTRAGFSIRRSAIKTDICNEIDRSCCGNDPNVCDFPSFDVRDWAATDFGVWAATANGAAEFDGGRWRARPGTGLADCRSIEALGDQVFAATAVPRGVYLYRPDTQDWIGAGEGLRPAQGLGDGVRLVAVGSNLWLCCSYGLFRWNGTAWESTGLEDRDVRGVTTVDHPVIDLAAASREGLWLRTLVGPTTEWQQKLADGPPQNVAGQAVAGAPDGTLWIGTLGGVMGLSTDGDWSSFRNGTAGGLEPFDVFSIFADSDNRLWVGKCCCRNPPSCPTQWVDGSDVSPALMAWDGWGMAEDSAHRLWIGTNSTGVTVLDADGEPVVTIPPATGGLASPSVRAVAVAGDIAWFGHEERGLQIARTMGNPADVAGYSWKNFSGTGSSPLPDPAVAAIELRGRDAWVLTASYLVHFVDEAKNRQWALNFDGEPRRGSGLAVDRSGNKWVGTSSGLLRIDSAGNLSLLTTRNSDIISDEILDVDLDPSTGDILLATRIGVSRLDPSGGPPPGPSADLYLYPNPFRPGEGQRVKVGGGTGEMARVTDLGGRPIVSFNPGAGWDGQLSDGRPAAPGIYLVTVDGGEPLRLALLR